MGNLHSELAVEAPCISSGTEVFIFLAHAIERAFIDAVFIGDLLQGSTTARKMKVDVSTVFFTGMFCSIGAILIITFLSPRN